MRSAHQRWAAAEFLLLEQFSHGVNTYPAETAAGRTGRTILSVSLGTMRNFSDFATNRDLKSAFHRFL